jgi:hypothetical protein
MLAGHAALSTTAGLSKAGLGSRHASSPGSRFFRDDDTQLGTSAVGTGAARKISTLGGSLRDVQMLAGHAALSTTQRYIEADAEAQRKVVDLI